MRRKQRGWWRRGMGALGVMAVLCLADAGPVRAQGAPDSVIATVNGDKITQEDFYNRLQRVRGQDFVASVNPPTLRGENAGVLMMNTLINEKLILQWAAKTRQMPTDAEVSAGLAEVKKQPVYAQALTDSLLTEDRLRYEVMVGLARFNIATTAVTVSPAEVDAYYKAHQDNYGVPEKWNIAVIRTTKPAQVPKIQAALKAGKAFADVAKMYSDEPKSALKGGLLGEVAANDPGLPVALRDAIRPLKVGEVTAPIRIEGRNGVNGGPLTLTWFVRLNARTPGQPTPLNDIRDQLRRTIMLERAGGYAPADKKIADFRKLAEVKILLPAYQKLEKAADKKP